MRLDYDAACEIAGRLYGNLLQRDSDPEGFAHAVEAMSARGTTPRALVREICTSEEFRERNVMNQTVNELARQLLVNLLRDRRPDPARVKALAVRLLQEDWRVVVHGLIDSEAYAAAHGDEGVPAWV